MLNYGFFALKPHRIFCVKHNTRTTVHCIVLWLIETCHFTLSKGERHLFALLFRGPVYFADPQAHAQWIQKKIADRSQNCDLISNFLNRKSSHLNICISILSLNYKIFIRMRDMSQIDPMMFQPFGAGPRNCIGVRFASVEIKMAMAKILRRFTILTSEDTPVGFVRVDVAYLYIQRSLTDFRYYRSRRWSCFQASV